MKRLLIIAFTLAGLVSQIGYASAQTSERITSYHSEIQIHQDSSMIVTETIAVVSAGEHIRRGIYRDFPIAYTDQTGRRYIVGFDLMSVTRNGAPEPYHTVRSGNGQRIYIGDEDVLIPHGRHEYSITYKTTRQLGFFEDHDELYWNVTGNGWVFPIESASARVDLPGEISPEYIDAVLYTGPQGSIAQNGEIGILEDGSVEFETTKPLGSYEGLTVVLSWPKGIVTPPSETENFLSAVWANSDYLVGALGMLLVLVYYLYFWNKVGRDPIKGAIIAQYDPPKNLTPAQMGFVKNMGKSRLDFAATIINLGVKGYVTVKENPKSGLFGSKTYTVQKVMEPKNKNIELSKEEQELLNDFFDGRDSLELTRSNAKVISTIKNTFDKNVKDVVGRQYFVKNTGALVAGVLLSVVVVAITIFLAMMVRFGPQSVLQYIFWPALGVSLLLINVVFGVILRAYTVAGRKLADEIQGFKLFLSVTEKDRLAFHNPPERTPELFEKMLPYALVLGVEHEWAEQFAQVFARLEVVDGKGYSPAWYYGSLGHFTPTAFASEVGDSFSGVVSSASTPPGSSSGGSGGFSGGGGGGGGGGGW